MAPIQPALSSVIPPLICGTATFNSQYNTDPFALPTTQIIERALALGIRAFDTSPYYGPSEDLLGRALSTPFVETNHSRSSYFLLTKVGRIGSSEFDYSPEWIQYSIQRSLRRLHTQYLDVVYCHDVEFVTPAEVLIAILELRRIRDTDGTIKYIGISGYPVPLLCELAELVLRETGEPLDAVQSYANFTLQNTALLDVGVQRLRKTGVSVVTNASVLGMGLLRSQGVPIGGKGDFHPAPRELRSAVMEAAKFVEGMGERLEVVAIRWGLETWAREGAVVGGIGGIGVSVVGVSTLDELEETMRVWKSVLDGLPGQEGSANRSDREWSIQRRKRIEGLAIGVWKVLGKWKDFTWASPEKAYANTRVIKGVVDEVGPMPATKYDRSKAML
jgi:D-arabinose 1-dehydrogenase